MDSKNLLELMFNEQLSSVEFVQDYLQLHFDDKTLTCFIWPSVTKDGFEYNNTHPDYKNKLCDFITKKVTNVIVMENINLIITFADESRILLSLNTSNPDIVGEIAILSDQDNNWSIFE